MTETDDLSARLAVLETVLRHLVTHLALRSDDPPRWVATRRVLALHEVHEHPPMPGDARGVRPSGRPGASDHRLFRAGGRRGRGVRRVTATHDLNDEGTPEVVVR